MTDRFNKFLVEVASAQERQAIVELLELKLVEVSGGVFDAKGVLRDVIAELKGGNK